MIRNLVGLGIIAVTVLPSTAFASVRINEIAWMGSVDNANAEWIELYNDSAEAVSLTGWTITASTGAPNITLTGNIPALGFFLLVRTNVNNIPGVIGDQAYTGALSNSGATLTLANNSGAVVDEVAGGTNWTDIGGDNATKKTPQRGGSGWVTASPTPKAPNAEIAGDSTDDDGAVTEETDTASTTPVTTIGGLAISASVPATLPKLYMTIGSSRRVSVFSETPYQAYVYDEKGKVLRSTEVSWSFGDGVREIGHQVRHIYEAPGTYLVVARAQNDNASTLRTLTVEAVPAVVHIGAITESGIEIENTSENITDISGWYLKAGSKRFRIPEDTALLPNAQVIFPASVTKLQPHVGLVSLLYSSGVIADERELATVELLSERMVAQ